MARPTAEPTGVERFFDEDEIIVSKTDPAGIITYANQVFLRVSGFTEEELLGQPHYIIRHPDMPRCVFKLLWDTIHAGEEIFAYVINQAKNGDHYWVYAHVTPTFGAGGEIVGYHSNRRVPSREAVDKMTRLYAGLLREESSAGSADGMQLSLSLLNQQLEEAGVQYDEFVFSMWS